MPQYSPSRGNQPGKGLRYLRERGLKEFAAHAREKVRDGRFDYQKWVRNNEISAVMAGYQRKLVLERMPKIHVMILPRPGRSVHDRERTIRSIRMSTYRRISLTQVLNSRILDEDFLAFVREGDLVTRDAFFEAVLALQPGADAVYTDEDSYEDREDGRFFSKPLFKPSYDPDYLRTWNYIGQLFLVRAGIIRELYDESFSRKGMSDTALGDEAQYYLMVLRSTDKAAKAGGVKHVAKVLCHTPAGESAEDPTRTKRLRRVLEEDIRLGKRKGVVEDGALEGTFHITWTRESDPLVSIVIPNKDQASVLENCIWSIRNRSTYRNYEIIVVENNSTQEETREYYRKLEEEGSARIVRYRGAFHFSRVINEGVKHAKGDYIILMNNDVTVRTRDWIERLLSQVMQPGVGAAGPKLLYPDGRVQSAGIVVGLMGFAGSMMVGEDGEDPGYMGRSSLVQDMSAVTAACMMVSRPAMGRAGGFPDEYAVALGDVDFCLTLGKCGYRIVYEPTAVMIHHESLTRGAEDSKEKKKRFAMEKAVFCRKWAHFLREGDPAYNPNLSQRRCDYSQQT